jgi:flagellar basal body-associated protein FliL
MDQESFIVAAILIVALGAVAMAGYLYWVGKKERM